MDYTHGWVVDPQSVTAPNDPESVAGMPVRRPRSEAELTRRRVAEAAREEGPEQPTTNYGDDDDAFHNGRYVAAGGHGFAMPSEADEEAAIF